MFIASAISLIRKSGFLLLLVPLLGVPVSGQNPLFDALARANSDVAEIRKRAEAGDAAAQVAFADILTTHSRHADALSWYLKAAARGNVAGQFHVGRTLLNGAFGDPSDQTVHADPVEGLRWTYMAATNHNRDASWDMSHALQRGMGTSVDVVAAYAWLELHFESSPGGYGSRGELNELALKMTTAEVDRALGLSAQFKDNRWQFPVTRVIPKDNSRLKLNGIITNGKESLAIINGKAVSEEETIHLDLKPGALNLKCLKIENDSVLISIEGEGQPRVLRLQH
jgi:hypothetical protein